jgi:hypothetical protein
MSLVIENDECIGLIKTLSDQWVEENIFNGKITYTKPGSITYLLYGAKPSEQSVNIKFGHFGEFLAKELIKTKQHLELLTCGVQQVNDKKKDVDLIWLDKKNKVIYYRELKGNIELDTEKLPATIHKCKEIEQSLTSKYPDCSINYGVFNWSIYNRKILTAGLTHIKTFESNGVKIDHMEDFLKILDISWNEPDWALYFRNIGTKIMTYFDE